MASQHISVHDLPDPSAHSYSHGIMTGGWLALAGQCGTGDDGKVVGDFAAQSWRVLERLDAIVKAAGGTKHDIVQMTVFITDIRYGREFTQIRKEFFGDRFPTSALIGVHDLMPPGALVEAQAWAHIPTEN